MAARPVNALRQSIPSLSLRQQHASLLSRSIVNSHRSNSTSASDSSPKSPPQAGATGPVKMPWPEYFKIRKNKRTWELATTFPTSILGFGGGVAYFGTLESTTPFFFGLDPMIASGLASAACLGLGWLLGPVVGGAFWRISHRKALASIEERDREFYHHIVKNRVDAARQSPVTPLPDYYGEKVGSLAQYRRWLRDQGKFKRKSELPKE